MHLPYTHLKEDRSMFAVHGIGQGLFYTADVEGFNFVYDCGALPTTDLHAEIESYARTVPHRVLDLVIVSHFDKDHVNGMTYLLKKLKSREVILPYLAPVERLLLGLKNAPTPAWYRDLLIDPPGFFEERGNSRVTLIGNGKTEDLGHDGPGDAQEPKPRGRETDKTEFDFHDLPEDEQTKRRFLELENHRNGKAIPQIRSHFGRLGVVTKGSWPWTFRFFNLEADFEDTVVDCLNGKGLLPNNKVDGQSLRTILADPRATDVATECYQEVFGKGNLNFTTLLMFHGAAYSLPHYRFSEGFDFASPPKVTKLDFMPQLGHFLTGDAELKSDMRWNEVASHYANYFGRLSGVLVPHHGSEKNWNSKLSKSVQSDANFFVSAGVGNKHGHPSIDVVWSITRAGHSVFWSTNSCGYNETCVLLSH